MSQKESTKADSLKSKLGDLLVGPLGEPIKGLANLRSTYADLQTKAEEELASTVELRAGDTDVSRHKKTVKEKEGELRTARDHLEAVSLKLGEEVCVAHGKGDLPTLIGLDEALAARAALSSLRTDYANLEPKPNAGLLAKGKAAAQRLVVSGKIVLQESKTNDLQMKLVQSAFDSGTADDLSCTHTADWLQKARDAYADVERRKAALAAAKAALVEVEARTRDIQQSDARVASIRQQSNGIKREIVEAFRVIVESSECEGVAERLSAAYLDLTSAEADIAAVEAQGRKTSGKIDKHDLLTEKVEMKTAQEMDSYCLSHGFAFRRKSELEHFTIIENHLLPDEVAYVAMAPNSVFVNGDYSLSGIVAVVFTSRHLIYAKKTMFGNEPVRMVRLELVTNVIKDTKHLLSGKIGIQTVSETITFGYSKNELDGAFMAVTAALERYRKGRPVDSPPVSPTPAAIATPAPSVVEQLKQFKELFDMGILTQEEFDAKKKQLLNT